MLDDKGGKIRTVISEVAVPCKVEVELQSLAPPARFSESILNIIEASSDEWASPGDCANGARVLAAALVEFAGE